MDHMIPQMDGIQATQHIRDLGYTGKIIALTANAVVGQADIFLSSGFDDFISKPIDLRRLNTLLRKYVRDIQPPEILEAARYHIAEYANEPEEYYTEETISPKLAELFIIDANRVLSVLDDTIDKTEPLTDDDIGLFTTSVHSMKSILIIIDETGLSYSAGVLEQAGRDKNIEFILRAAPDFASRLRSIVKKYDAKNNLIGPDTDKLASYTPDADAYAHLHKKINIIKEAVGSYDNKTAKDALNELRSTTWTPEINELLGTMAEQLLSGDTDGLLDSTGKLLNNTG